MKYPSVSPPLKHLSLVGLNPTYRDVIKKFNDFCHNHAESKDLVADFLSEMARTKSIATLNTYKAAIKKAMKSEMAQNRMDTSGNMALLEIIFKEIRTGSPQVKVQKEQVLSPGEFDAIIHLSGIKTGLIINALYQTAARVSELVNIKLSDCRVTDQGVVIRVLGKGGKVRSIFMSIDVFRSICNVYLGKVYLFETDNGTPLNRRTVHTLIKRAGNKIGRPDIHAHTLRHSFATHRLQDLGIDAVSEYLGHSSPEVTAKYYLHKSATIEEVLQGSKSVGKN